MEPCSWALATKPPALQNTPMLEGIAITIMGGLLLAALLAACRHGQRRLREWRADHLRARRLSNRDRQSMAERAKVVYGIDLKFEDDDPH